MIWYITLGTNDFDKAVNFYDSLLSELWASRFLESDTFIVWTNQVNGTGISVTKPFDKQPATVWNGSMVAIMGDSTTQVDNLYKKAIELGASDEWKPGFRWEGGFYAWYIRDLDGNKLNFFCIDTK